MRQYTYEEVEWFTPNHITPEVIGLGIFFVALVALVWILKKYDHNG